MRRTDAEFVRHTLQEVVLKWTATDPKSDAFLTAKINKASKLLENEENKTVSYPFDRSSQNRTGMT